VGVPDQADEDRREHGEDVRLQEGHKYLKEHHCQGHSDSPPSNSPSDPRDIPEYEYEADEGKDDRVSCGHVGEKPDHQSEGLGQLPHQLHRSHDHQHDDRSYRPHAFGCIEDGLGVARSSQSKEPTRLDYDQTDDGQRPRHHDVSGGGSSPGHESQEIHGQDEEEQGENEGRVNVGPVADVPPNDLITEVEDHPLHGIRQAARSLALVLPGDRSRYGDEKDCHEKGRHRHEHHVLGG
jgi:hypothetical protein